jgi:Holliday junction resolvasome RuvABC endonuclease subunit
VTRLVLRKTTAANPYKPFGQIGDFLTVDPGLGGTGWALWSRSVFDKLVPPTASGTITLPQSMDDWPWQRRAKEIGNSLHSQVATRAIGEMYVEEPQFFEAGKGIAAARTGDLVKLAVTAGVIIGACCGGRTGQLEPKWISIVQWKGQVDKEVVRLRVMKRLSGFPNWKPRTNTSHEIDAIGMGLFIKGYFS